MKLKKKDKKLLKKKFGEFRKSITFAAAKNKSKNVHITSNGKAGVWDFKGGLKSPEKFKTGQGKKKKKF